jgi:RHS repeat-associated protein
MFLYNGEYGVLTDENNLLHMRARFYNPEIKRFLNEDPIQDGLNWYAYAGGNPINRLDPSGESLIAAAIILGATAIGMWSSNVSQLEENVGDWSKINTWETFGVGVVAGGSTAAMMIPGVSELGMVGTMIWAGIIGFEASNLTQLIMTGDVNYTQAVLDGIFSACTAGILKGLQLMGGNPPKNGSLSNLEARKWYLEQQAKIPDLIDKSLPLEQQAKQAFELRNMIRTLTRNAMADQEAARTLFGSNPNMTWEQIVAKYTNLGYTGDALWQEIIDAAQRSNKAVNNFFGITY